MSGEEVDISIMELLVIIDSGIEVLDIIMLDALSPSSSPSSSSSQVPYIGSQLSTAQ